MKVPLLGRMAIAAAALSVVTATPALARDAAIGPAVTSLSAAAATLSPGRYLWQDDESLGPISVLVSIPDQRAYVYRGDTVVAVTTVSTGKDGKETPVGVFTILQKKEMNHSTLYDNAPMPFMQRLTWDGIAIHAGKTPGFPASHGCIRVPAEFAKKLYAATQLGVTVEVSDLPFTEGTPAPVSDAQQTAAANRPKPASLDTFLASR